MAVAAAGLRIPHRKGLTRARTSRRFSTRGIPGASMTPRVPSLPPRVAGTFFGDELLPLALAHLLRHLDSLSLRVIHFGGHEDFRHLKF